MDAIVARRAARGRGELGYTLIEMVVLVAILGIAAGFGYAGLAQRPAQARSAAATFAGLVAEARALAAVTGDAASTDATGASIGIARDGNDYIATLYAYRPIRSAPHGPIAAPNTPPLRTSTAITIVQANQVLQPPFALFFSASGHASAQAHFTIGADAPLAAEPACPPQTGIIIHFADGVVEQAFPISCEMAQLDLDASSAARELPDPVSATSHR